MKIFGYEIGEKALNISDQDRLYRALYETLMSGVPLHRDTSSESYVTNGWGNNPDVYSITDRISTVFSMVPVRLYKMLPDGSYEIAQDDRIGWLSKPNEMQSEMEFRRLWELFLLVTGNAIVYRPVLTRGNDQGKPIGKFQIMPSQYTEIKSGGWKDPVMEYLLTINETVSIPAVDVWHTRLPNLEYKDGANFMGASPVKIAAELINSQNYGYEIIAKTLSRGFIPGILSKDGDADDRSTQEQKGWFEKIWRQKYSRRDRSGTPIFTLGKLTYTPIGLSNFRDLQIIEASQHGLRVLCSIWGVPSIIFNDISGTTFNNRKEARQEIYTNRVMPDLVLYCQGLTEIVKMYDKSYCVRPDYSEVQELQVNKTEIAAWAGALRMNNAISRNEMRTLMGLAVLKDPRMDDPFYNEMPSFGDIPPVDNAEDNTEDDTDDVEDEMKNMGLTDYK